MRKIDCSRCGSNEFDEKSGYRICLYCGTRYQLTSEDLTLRNSSIDLDSDIERLLQKCRNEPQNAKRYANLILDIEPSNKEAKKYL